MSASETCRLEFLGGRVDQVFLKDMQIDEWDRFHAFVGSERIPAVLSRKAQAALLLELSKSDRVIPGFSRFRDPQALPKTDLDASQDPSESGFWSRAYTSAQDGWELGSAHPAFSQKLTALAVGGRGTFLVPGAGRGHDAVLLAQLFPSFHIRALDFAPEAELYFRQRNDLPANLSFERCDVFEFLPHPTSAGGDGGLRPAVFLRHRSLAQR